MFDRVLLKQAAKNRISAGGRWNAALVCLVTMMLGAAGSGFSINVNMPLNESSTTSGMVLPEVVAGILYNPAAIFAILFMVVLLFGISIVFSVFVSNVIFVGLMGWFMRYSRGEATDVGALFATFRIYRPAVLTMLLQNVYIFLWSFLLIIPGIVKSYAYCLTPFIIYENPNLSAREAIRLSETMMDGWKLEMFTFGLSFFGWQLLSAMTCGILGVVYVNPYYYTSLAMMYDTIKHHAVYYRRVIDPAVFGMPPIYTPPTPEA